MEKSNRLGGQEFFALLVITTSSVMFFTTPRRFFAIGANAAWLSAVMAIGVAAICVTIIGLLLKRHPGKGLLELNCLILGSTLGSVMNLLLALYFASVGALIARILAEAIVMTALPELPVSLVVLGTISLALYGSLRGWNVIAKTCWVSFPFLAVGVIVPLVLTAGRWTPDYLYPLMGNGFTATILGGVSAAGVVGDIILVAILARALQPEVQPLSVGVRAVVASGFLVITVILATSMVFPYPVAGHLTLPYYMLSRSLSFGRFLQRLESLALVLWAFAAFLKVTVTANAGLYIFDQVFNIPDHRPLVLPHGAIIFALAMIPPSFLAATDYVWFLFRIYGGMVSLALPTLIALVGLLRLKPSRETEGKA